MKKYILFSIIFILILTTSFIKNSTKKIEDKIFVITENIRFLNKRLSDEALEHSYLSSSQKLLNFRDEYFDDTLFRKNLKNIKKLSKKNDEFLIKDLNNKLEK